MSLQLLRDPLSLSHENFCPREIATALSRINRYCGRGAFALSVAQHSTLLSFAVPYRLRFAALVHDVCEAFIGDVPSSAKCKLTGYDAIEEQLNRHIGHLLSIPYEQFLEVTPFDHAIRIDEVRALFDIVEQPSKLGMIVEPQSPEEAARDWHERFLILSMEKMDAA